jgi:CHAT domain-containing protein
MKLFFNLVLWCLTLFCFGQTWQQLDSLCYELNDIKPDSAILLGKKAIEGCIKEKGKNSLEYAVCLDHIAWAYKTKTKLNVSDSLYREAVETVKSIKQTQTQEYAEIINNMAALYHYQGRYAEAELLFKESKAIREKVLGKTHPEYALSCNNLAVLYRLQSRYAEAETLFKESKAIREKVLGKTHSDYAQSCNNLAVLYKFQGRYAEAEPLFKESQSIREKVLGKTHPDYAQSCNNLALLYQDQGGYAEAEVLYKEAKAVYEKVLGKTHLYYAQSCNNLAVLYQSQGRYAEAEPLYKEAKTVYEKVLGKTHPEYATSCNNLAVLYQMQGRYADSEPLFKEALAVIEKVLGKTHLEYAGSCNNLAVLYHFQGRYAEAEVLYKESKTIIEKVLGKTHPEYAKSCSNLAVLYQLQGMYSNSELLYKEAIELKFDEIRHNFKNLSENEKEKYIKANVEKYFDGLQSFVKARYVENPTISEDSYNLTLEVKGLILQSTEKIKNRILNSKDSILKNTYLEWKESKNRYVKAQNLSISQRKERKLDLDSIARRCNELEKQLALKSEDFANTFAPKPITWKDIQNVLKKDQAAIEMVRINAKENRYGAKDSIIYMALIVKKESKYPEIVIIDNRNTLENNYLTLYRRSISTKVTDKESYNAFWKPIAEKLKGIKTVYFSSDGVYHQVNLSTLQNPATKKYVADEIQVINVTNTKDILENKKFNAKNSYLIGNPKFNLEIDTKNNEKPVEQRSIENLSQLEGAEKEVKEASGFLKNVKTVVGVEATEEYVKSIKNPRILHIATHGYFKKGQYQSSTQAMLNAGLLFAGVVDYDRMDIRPYDKEDGKLTAFEVMNMELDSTELVVLSACETGLGQASKEGVYGLQRAFKVAGAQTIIMSLWKVSDEATQLLMTKFYENWQKKGMDKRKAFESAQKDLRKQYKEPYYWGAFVMIE